MDCEIDENDFANHLLNMLEQFHEFQRDDKHFGEPPYKYDTLGLAEWLEFDYFKPTKPQQGGENAKNN